MQDCVCCPYNCIQLKCVRENSLKLHAVNHHNQCNISLSHFCFLLTLAPGHEIFDLQGEISLLHLRTAAFTRYWYGQFRLMHHRNKALKKRERQLNRTRVLSTCLADSHEGCGLISCSLCSFLSFYSLWAWSDSHWMCTAWAKEVYGFVKILQINYKTKVLNSEFTSKC